MDKHQDMTPTALAKTTSWLRDSWQRAYDVVAADGRLDWREVVTAAIKSGQGPSIAYTMISVLDEYSRDADL